MVFINARLTYLLEKFRSYFFLPRGSIPHGPQVSLEHHSHREARSSLTKNEKRMETVGRIGFLAKAIVYGTIGGVAIAAVAHTENATGPQGAFILLGNNAVGVPILIVIAVGVGFYAAWRFFEAVTGQGYDHSKSRAKNFFSVHLSPFVSGCMYTGYLVYLWKLISLKRSDRNSDSSFFDSWPETDVGKAFLAILGICFLAAFLSQMRPAIFGNFKNDLRKDMKPWFRKTVYTLGHIGFFGRGITFLTIAILFFRAASGETAVGGDSVGNALQSLATNWWGNIVLTVIGLSLLIYAVFAFLNCWVKIFLPSTSSRRYREGQVPPSQVVHLGDAANFAPAPPVILEMEQGAGSVELEDVKKQHTNSNHSNTYHMNGAHLSG